MSNHRTTPRLFLVSLCLLTALLFTPQKIQAAPVRDFTVGWVFDVNATINVDALGIWDEGGNGLIHTHQVGL